MGSAIHRLPDSVHNTVRSGILLYDLTRVVEELVFNSLDAGAKKVSVYVGVGTCYVKVVDDGCGIDRDGLVLLGQRYVTSKDQNLGNVCSMKESFGFRGEALASISDISLLEIVTKAPGRPNGYRKIVKGSKCLYLGIDDDRKDVGTTVSVRDLFYNQPVRRKCMRSSTKKILHSIKKCLLRIALVRSTVSFKIVDTESEDELLCTHPSSMLSLMMNGFGIVDTSCLHELNSSDGVFKISGYLSGPTNSFSIKAFQYVYINSRFVCKGPVHKLVNHLANRCESADPWSICTASEKGRRSRAQARPAYIINLGCPSYLYDLTYEPSKTRAEFKDWAPLLAFIEKAVQQLWSKSTVNSGEFWQHEGGKEGDKFTLVEEDLSDEVVLKNCKMPNELSSHYLTADEFWKDEGGKEVDKFISVEEDSSDEVLLKSCKLPNELSPHHLILSPSGMITNETEHAFNTQHKAPFQEFYRSNPEYKEQQAAVRSVCHRGYSCQSWDGSVSKCSPTVTHRNDSHWLAADHSFLLPGDCTVEDGFFARESSRTNLGAHILSSEWHNKSPKIKFLEVNETDQGPSSLDCQDPHNALDVYQSNKSYFLKRCSLQRSPELEKALFGSVDGFEFPTDGFQAKRRRVCIDENTDILDVNVGNQGLDIFPWILQQDVLSCTPQFPRVGLSTDNDLLSTDSLRSSSLRGEPFTEQKCLSLNSVLPLKSSGSGNCSLSLKRRSLTSDASFQSPAGDFEDFQDDNAYTGSTFGKMANYQHFLDNKEDCKSKYDVLLRSSYQDTCMSSHTRGVLDFEYYADSTKDARNFLQGHDLNGRCSVGHSDQSAENADLLVFDSHRKGHRINGKYKRGGHPLRNQDQELEERSRRSYTAPPFYRRKTKFVSLYHCSITKQGQSHSELSHDGVVSPEANKLKHLYSRPNYAGDLDFNNRPNAKYEPVIVPKMSVVLNNRNAEHSQHPQALDLPVEGFMQKETESIDYGSKWRNGEIEEKNKFLRNSDTEPKILDICSGFLHLAGSLLVPESLHKNCLEGAKVLQQVDKKFIPVVAGRTLAVIDQHAADERIRLEELRQKVFSGEARTVTYLDSEEELNLPEMGFQLLHNYAEQIREWGWICNIQTRGSGSFKKSLNILHQQATVVKLLAVPCILGVNLSEGDLLEFLQQLADTDGSSTLPPSVLRILNSKACRGAIMFGDALLPSECALIVDELKQTSLCFQCAHGRPTTAPLVNLEALHQQVAKLGLSDDGSRKAWHGLRRQEKSLERAARRLSAARGIR